MVLYCSDYWTSIKPVNWTAILAVTQSNQSTGQPSWQSLNQTRQLDSHPGSHSIKPASESWRPVGRLEEGVKDQTTAAISQQLWTSGGALVQRAQEPNIPFGESLTSIFVLTNMTLYILLRSRVAHMIHGASRHELAKRANPVASRLG